MAAFSEVLAGALMLLSLYALVRAQRGPRWLLAVSYLAAAMAFLTKETALALPLMAALFVRRRAWPLFAIAGGSLLLRFATLGHGVAGLPQRPLLGHLHVIAAAALQYTKKLIWPWPLAPEYHLAHPPAAWVAFAIVCALAAWAATRYREVRVALLLVFLADDPCPGFQHRPASPASGAGPLRVCRGAGSRFTDRLRGPHPRCYGGSHGGAVGLGRAFGGRDPQLAPHRDAVDPHPARHPPVPRPL